MSYNQRKILDAAYRQDETLCVEHLLAHATFSPEAETRIKLQATEFIAGVRERRLHSGSLDAFLIEYDLSSAEGVVLMCLAEAYLRIPDTETVNKLLRDKLSHAEWHTHQGQSHSLFVNAMTWSLMLTGDLLTEHTHANLLSKTLKNLISKSGMPAIRMAVSQMMKIMSGQFVMGQTIDDAIKRARETEKMGYRYSYDMLGEAARTRADAERYFHEYERAIAAVAQVAKDQHPSKNPGISVKLSALHPRYDYTQRERVVREVAPLLLKLAQLARTAHINLTVDAEEADRLDLSLDIIEQVFCDESLTGWEGFGLAVQSYQKRAWYLLDKLSALARSQQRRIMVRLIKGAYWDSEIKRTQQLGLNNYPVFTRKVATDVSFLACAKKIAAAPDAFYAQFATHNASSLAAILELMQGRDDFELQCLHGMGRTLYDQIIAKFPVRVYAPVGGYHDLLAYLVRRLLENGANTSFVNRIADATAPIDALIESPVKKLINLTNKANPQIPLPSDLFGATRKNSAGIDLSNRSEYQQLQQTLAEKFWEATPLLACDQAYDLPIVVEIKSARNPQQILGTVFEATQEQTQQALKVAHDFAAEWSATAVESRALILEKMADLLQQEQAQFIALLIREAGKITADAISELREAIDFCRYYASEARRVLAEPLTMPGVTGEINQLKLVARGVTVCISPWNFPLAIFMGQISAALVAGNPVIAKPAEQTPLIAYAAVDLFYRAGLPLAALQLLPGSGEIIGAQLVADQRVKAVVFTGSTETARLINQSLAARPGAIIPFIAETGGQNVLIADSSALPEQLIQDVLYSAFNSAGQRCSALRILCVQEEIADRVIYLLQGAMQELVVGDPELLTTDVGPVIDAAALTMLQAHQQKMMSATQSIATTPLPEEISGHFFAPCAFAVKDFSLLAREVFGPILHVRRFTSDQLDELITEINNLGYGLTFGIHSRISSTIDYVCQRVRAGNYYVNRNMIGAVVGVQAFGGEGLSGTGPKGGGPHYLLRLVTERSISVDTTAAGGNASLLALGE